MTSENTVSRRKFKLKLFIEDIQIFWVAYIFSDITQKMEFSIKDFFNNYDQIRSFLRIWSHLLKKISFFVQCKLLIFHLWLWLLLLSIYLTLAK